MLEISADKIAFVVIRARDYDQGLDGRGGRNAYELRDFIADLNDDEQAMMQKSIDAVKGLVDGRYQWVVFTSTNAVRAVWEVGERVAALDGVSALAWHGLTGYQDERVHVSVPHTARVSAPGDVVLHKVARRAAGEVLARAVPVTAPLWASVRAGHWAVSDRQAALLLVMPVQQRLVDAAALRDLTRQPPGRTRRRHLREIGEAVHGGVESIGELDLGAMCRRHALPPPSRQVVRETPGGRCYLDAFWEEAGFGIEVDGSGHRAGAHVALDHLRTNDLVIGGEPLLRVDLLGLRLYEGRFAAQIRSMLARPRRSR